jgi:hypothetical protein
MGVVLCKPSTPRRVTMIAQDEAKALLKFVDSNTVMSKAARSTLQACPLYLLRPWSGTCNSFVRVHV